MRINEKKIFGVAMFLFVAIMAVVIILVLVVPTMRANGPTVVSIMIADAIITVVNDYNISFTYEDGESYITVSAPLGRVLDTRDMKYLKLDTAKPLPVTDMLHYLRLGDDSADKLLITNLKHLKKLGTGVLLTIIEMDNGTITYIAAEECR